MKTSGTEKWSSWSFLRSDIQLVLAVLLLTLIGAFNFYSITHAAGSPLSALFGKQMLWFAIGGSFFILLSFLNYKIFLRFSPLIYGLNLFFLVLVLFIGQTSQGAQRWIDLGAFSYQPAETMQIAVMIILAHLFAKKSVHSVYGFKQVLPAFLLTTLPMALIIYQPDLGTALLLGIQSLTLVCFLKITRRVFLSLIALVLIIAPALWMFTLRDYQKERVIAFLSPVKDPQGSGYNTIQSKIAIGSGQVFGKGFRDGTQSHLEFLPESHTDFAFSVLSEEHGFTGSVFVLALFFFLIFKILKTAGQSKDKEGVYLCLGVSSILFWHLFVNVGMASGILPVVGVPLPFLSYGGTSQVSIFIALGLVSSVLRRRYVYS